MDHPRPVVTDPLGNQSFETVKSEIAERVAEEPLIDTVLEPGDALYLPRGTVHSALALGETSIHLTVGVHPLTRYELVRFLLDAVQDDPQLRVSLPVGADLGDPDVLAPHLEMTVAALQEALARSRRPGSPSGSRATSFSARARRPSVRSRSSLPRTRSPWIRPCSAGMLCGSGSCPRTTASCVRLEFLDRRIDLPAGTADAVGVIVDRGVFSPAELPGLDATDQLTVSRRLLREGIVVPA